MVDSPRNSNAYTDQEKKFLVGPAIVLTLAVSVFLYTYSTIPSRGYDLHSETSHAEASHEAAAPAGHAHEAPAKH